MKRHHFWFISLAIATAFSLIFWGQTPNLQPAQSSYATVQAQTPSPSPEATVTPSPSPEVNVSPSPEADTEVMVSPSPDPTATASPSPEATITPSPDPTASPSPEATITPSPDPTASPSPTPIPQATPVLPLAAEAYQDPGGRFTVGVLQDYTQSVVSGVPLFESPDGQLAYTVSVRPRSVDVALRDWILTQVAIDTYARGEGMIAGSYEPAPSGGVKIPWTGQLTQGRNQTPMQGVMLSRQVPGQILILMVAATEESADQVDWVFSTLEPTLQSINN